MQLFIANFFRDLSSWPSAKFSTLSTLAGIQRITCTASLHGWSVACYQLNNLISPVTSILLKFYYYCC